MNVLALTSHAGSLMVPLNELPNALPVPNRQAGNGHLIFSINDQTMVADFPGKSDQEFVQQLKYKAGSESEVRLTVFLLADRNSKSDASVSLNVTAIDTDLAKHKN